MPKNRKTRKQKIRASIKPHTAVTTGVAASTPQATSTQPIKIPEKFSLQHTMGNNFSGAVMPHAYRRRELLKTSFLSVGIIAVEIIFFLLLRNHLLVLPYVSY